MAEPLLRVHELRTWFYTEGGVAKAVDGVSFEIGAGETVGLVGESGSGKSVTALSLLRLVYPPGRIEPGSEILFEGRNLVTLDERDMRAVRGARISMVFQEPMTVLNPVFTVGDQIAEVVRVHKGGSKREAWDRAVKMLETVGIPSPAQRAHEYPHQLSGGMRQRVVIAMALVMNPALVIADEPTTALDVTIQAQILDLMRNLQQEHNTALMMITHDLGVVAGMTDRIQVMYAGHVVETAPTEELFGNPRHPYTVGLLNSIPRLDQSAKSKLNPIRGLPPDLIDLPDMCPFLPRCDYAREKCEQQNPPLLEVNSIHRAACWFWEEVSKEGPRT